MAVLRGKAAKAVGGLAFFEKLVFRIPRIGIG
jgi:hypothetical protein